MTRVEQFEKGVRSMFVDIRNLFSFARSRGWFLVILTSLCVVIPSSVIAQPLAKGHTKFLGNVFGSISGVPLNYDLYWNQITPENNGKWGSVEGTKNSYSWTRLDEIYNYAINNFHHFRFHTLVWGQQYPSWITSLDSASQYQEVEEWIRLVGERYASMSFIDVVNEPLHAPPPYKNALGGNGTTGWDWVIKAFEFARQHIIKGAKLHLNDYGIINSGSATSQYLGIINLLKERGLIDGIGVQGHRFELENADTNTLKSNLTALAATGLPIYITEMDVAPSNQLNDATQLAEYQRIFPVIWRHPGVKGVTLWGYIQYLTWQSNAYLITSGGTERPALQWLRTYLASTATSVETQPDGIPADLVLEQNFPNPFNPSTTIRYSLTKSSTVRLTIYNVLGVKVRNLEDSERQRGDYSVVWDGKDDSGEFVPSGIYVYRLVAGDALNARRMLLVR